MIDAVSQNELFELISSYLKKDVKCFVFGGSAMLFYGYKSSTKDIDLLFEKKADREAFIDAITILGYKKRSLIDVFPKEKQKLLYTPLLFSRGDERFDLFLGKIFQISLSDNMKSRLYARHDYVKKSKTLSVGVLSKEDIILLKSVTERERDFDDIRRLVQKESNINWDIIIEEALFQYKRGVKWILLDLEETLRRLKEYIFIPRKHFDKLYSAHK
jgi:hypothetical protein